MYSKNLYGRAAGEDDYDLAAPPEADLPVDPYDNSLAMLGEPMGGTGEMPPSEAGPGADLAALGMMVQGAQMLGARRPGFVPVEIMMWLQQAMQLLPQMIQQDQSGLGAMVPGAGAQGAMAGQMGALAPAAGQPPQSNPSGPPRQAY